MRKSRIILWKEIKDLSRDYKTLVYVVFMPLIALPGMAILSGGLYTAQEVTVGVIDMDRSGESRLFVRGLVEYLSSRGFGANVKIVEGVRGDFTIIVEQGFGEAVRMLDGTATVTLLYVPGSPLFQSIESTVRSYIAAFERAIVENRIEDLASRAGVEVDPQLLLDPVKVEVGFRSPAGEPVGREAGALAFSSKIIAFSLFFVVNPAIVFMSDAIVGEKERRSLERLLVAPASRVEILVGKMAASMMLGLAAAAADSVAIVGFFILSGTPVNVSIMVIAAWIASTFLLVVLTSSLVAIISSRSGSLRSAQAGSFTVMMVALAIYFSSLVVDVDSLPGWVKSAMLAIPFTHASLAIYRASFQDIESMALHLAALAAFSIIFILLALKSFESERLVAYRG